MPEELAYHGFPRLAWFDGRSAYEANVLQDRELRRGIERAASGRDHRTGTCLACRQRVEFLVPSGNTFGTSPDLREGWRCPECHCNNRQRLLLHAARETLGRECADVYLAESLSPLSVLLRDEPWRLTLSEYVDPNLPSGRAVEVAGHELVHQDLTRTTFPTACFDLVIHAEVLEHVPEWQRLLAEVHRMLRPGGWTLFSVPFLENLDATLVRAVQHGATTQHLLPPELHDAPLEAEGVLVYQVPGWDLLDVLADTGFTDCEVGWLSDVNFGVTSNNSDYANYMEPVVFRARKHKRG